MEPEPNVVHPEHRRTVRKFLGATGALLALALVALWFLWGFRWPPTAEVVIHDTESADVGPEVTPRYGPEAEPAPPPR